jgi:metal-responsive CopG/Arc/MetJ family transcriptional regulator
MVAKITIAIPIKLLQEIDEAAKADYTSRSDYIRKAAILRLKASKSVDLW